MNVNEGYSKESFKVMIQFKPESVLKKCYITIFIINNELLDNQQLFSHCKSRKILAEASAEAAVACRCRRCC